MRQGTELENMILCGTTKTGQKYRKTLLTGTGSSVGIPAKIIYQIVQQLGLKDIVLEHNHPGQQGVPTPSRQDMLTNTLLKVQYGTRWKGMRITGTDSRLVFESWKRQG